jgi:hypothetical protein
MIVDTLSYPERLTYEYDEALSEVCGAGAATGRAPAPDYYCDREALLKFFRVFKGLSDSKMEFSDMESLLCFLRKHVEHADMKKTAFATAVMKEIELLEIIKDDKIKVTVKKGKKNLEDSDTYKIFTKREEDNGSES